MRSFWSQVPTLRVAFPLIAGIGLQIAARHFFGPSRQLVLCASIIFFLSLALTLAPGFIKDITRAYTFRVLNGVALTVLIMSFGFILTWFYDQKNYPTHFSNFLEEDSWLIVTIDEPPVMHEKSITATALVTQVHNHQRQFETTGNIQLNFKLDSLMTKPNYGDVILIKSDAEEITGPKNPDEFNFKNYQAFRNIYHNAFLTRGSWVLLDSAKGNAFLARVYRLRDNFLEIIERYVKDKNDFGVASSIMLGYRDYVNADITRAYASSGTIHVLSVSGLHVGIMFILLNFLLKWMDGRGKKYEISKAVFIISFIWFYACLTGLSPPVLRSAIMFSLIQMGKVLVRNVNMYNIVTASAILLMLVNPFVIMDVGFQLSYIAVFGIVYIYPVISNLIVIKIPKDVKFSKQKHIYKLFALVRYDLKWLGLYVLDFFWQLMAVSIAAQIATLPLTLLYFYQFPNLFLISNLVVIPLSNLVLFTGTALFAVAHIPYLGPAVGWLFNGLLHVLDAFIFGIERWPFALTKGVCISGFEMVLLYTLIFLLCWLLVVQRPKVLIASLMLVLGLCSFNSYKYVRNAGVKELVVYSIPKQKAIAFISGNKVLYDFDSTLLNDQNAMSFHVLHHWWNLGVKTQAPAPVISYPVGRLVLFEGKRILIVDTNSVLAEPKGRTHHIAMDDGGKDFSNFPPGPKLKKMDLVIITGNPKVSIDKLLNFVDFEEIVFDSSNNASRVAKWVEDCEAKNIRYRNVNKQGAFVEKWRDS